MSDQATVQMTAPPADAGHGTQGGAAGAAAPDSPLGAAPEAGSPGRKRAPHAQALSPSKDKPEYERINNKDAEMLRCMSEMLNEHL